LTSNIVLYTAAWLTTLRTTIADAMKSEHGQGIVEYAILLGAVVLVAAGALYALDIDFAGFADEIDDCFEFGEDCGIP
jgi:hypothetical protein